MSNDKSTEPPSQSGNIPSGSYMSDTGSSCKRYSNSKIITNNSQWSHCRNESSFKPFNDDYKQYGHGQKQQFKRDAQPHFKKFHREGNNTLPSLGRGRGHSYCSKFKSPQYRTSCSEQLVFYNITPCAVEPLYSGYHCTCPDLRGVLISEVDLYRNFVKSWDTRKCHDCIEVSLFQNVLNRVRVHCMIN